MKRDNLGRFTKNGKTVVKPKFMDLQLGLTVMALLGLVLISQVINH